MNATNYSLADSETAEVPSGVPQPPVGAYVAPANAPQVPADDAASADEAGEATRSRRGPFAALDKRLLAVVCAASFVFGIAGGVAGGAAMVAATGSGSQAGASQPGALGGGPGQDNGGAPMMDEQGQGGAEGSTPGEDGSDMDTDGGDGVAASVGDGGTAGDSAYNSDGADIATSVGGLLGKESMLACEALADYLEA